MRSGRNWGCGDFRDLRDVVDWVAEDLRGQLCRAQSARTPSTTGDPSIPAPTCPTAFSIRISSTWISRAWRISSTAGARSPCASSPAVEAEIAALRASPAIVEYERVSALKLRFLKFAFVPVPARVAHRFGPRARVRCLPPARRRPARRLRHLLRAGRIPAPRATPTCGCGPSGPPPYQDPHSPETAGLSQETLAQPSCSTSTCSGRSICSLPPRRNTPATARLSIGLYHDLALATDRFGSDLWAHRAFLRRRLPRRLAARRFFARGPGLGLPSAQLRAASRGWLPPLRRVHPQELPPRRRAAHRPRDAPLPPLSGFPTALPRGKAPTSANSTWTTCASWRWRACATRWWWWGRTWAPWSRRCAKTLARFGILSYRLFYFEKNERGEFRRNDEYPPQALVSSTTHDLPTLAGFWAGTDIQARLAAQLDRREAAPGRSANPAPGRSRRCSKCSSAWD